MIIPAEIKRQCILQKQQGKTVREIYQGYYKKIYPDTKYETFKRMLYKWQKKHLLDNEYINKGVLTSRMKPHAATVQLNADGEIVQSWIKSNDYTSAIEELVVACRALPKIKIEKPIDIKAEPLLLEISFFDMHWGVNDYKYYYDTLRKTLAVIQSRKWERVAIQIGQDLFHNDDFRGRTTSGTNVDQVDMVQAWNDARNFYYNIIDYAIENAEQVTIMHTPGNHDETISWAFNQMIKAQYGDAIEIDDTLDDYKLIHWRECFIGITHGEKVKGKAETLRGIYTSFYPIEFANSKVRALHVGHLHHYSGKDLFGLDMRQLPTRAKEDEWHTKNGYVGANKRFELFIWSTGELHSIVYV